MVDMYKGTSNGAVAAKALRRLADKVEVGGLVLLGETYGVDTVTLQPLITEAETQFVRTGHQYALIEARWIDLGLQAEYLRILESRSGSHAAS